MNHPLAYIGKNDNWHFWYCHECHFTVMCRPGERRVIRCGDPEALHHGGAGMNVNVAPLPTVLAQAARLVPGDWED